MPPAGSEVAKSNQDQLEDSPKLSFGKKLVLIICVALVTVALIEGVLRIFKLPLPDRFFAPNDDFGWFHIPGRTGWQRTPELEVPVSINQQGLRDANYPYEKGEGIYRIFLLGDSFVEGLQVPIEHTLAKQLQTRLNASAGGIDYEVINGGVSRFGTDNEILFYDFEGRKYDPDGVILFFFYNDLYDNVEKPYFLLQDGTIQPVDPKPMNTLGPAGELRGWLWDQFHFYRLLTVVGNLLGYLVELAGPRIESEGGIPFLLEDPEDQMAAMDLTGALLESFNRDLAADGKSLLVVGIGEMSAVEHAEQEPPSPTEAINRDLGESLSDRGVEYLNLVPGFRTHYGAENNRLFWPGDGHWNSDGHALAADLVLDRLSDLGWLGDEP